MLPALLAVLHFLLFQETGRLTRFSRLPLHVEELGVFIGSLSRLLILVQRSQNRHLRLFHPPILGRHARYVPAIRY